MNLTSANMEALKTLVEQDPALQKDLGNASSRQEFTSRLATAALAKDIVIDETELGKVMDVAFDQYGEKAELSDEQLQDVTGGVIVATGLALLAGALLAPIAKSAVNGIANLTRR